MEPLLDKNETANAGTTYRPDGAEDAEDTCWLSSTYSPQYSGNPSTPYRRYVHRGHNPENHNNQSSDLPPTPCTKTLHTPSPLTNSQQLDDKMHHPPRNERHCQVVVNLKREKLNDGSD